MTVADWWGVALDAATLLVLGLTFWAVWRYARDTQKIKEAAIEQSEAVQKPCLTVATVTESAELSGGEKSYWLAISPFLRVRLRNVGSGPALNGVLELHDRDSRRRLFREEIPPLESKGSFEGTRWPGGHQSEIPKRAELTVTYESMSKKAYQTRIQTEGTRVVSFRFLPIESAGTG